MNSVRRSLGYTFFSSNAVTLIQFVSTIVLSRLLSPAEVGIYSVAAVMVAVIQFLRDFGVSAYVIQAKALSRELLQASLGLLVIMGFTVGTLLLASSGSIARFYDEPLLQSVIYVLSVNFFISPLGSLTLTVARRNMQFSDLAIVNITSGMASAAVSIVLAFMAYGPISLAWGGVAGTLAAFVMSLRLRPPEMPWLPSLKGVGAIMTFGVTSSSASVLGHLNASISDLMLGRLLSMEAVGFFNRASSLNQFINRGLSSAIGPVLLPWLSEINRSGHRLSDAFQKATERTTVFTWPAFAMVALLAEPIIGILFGPQWLESVPLVVYLSMSAIIGSTYSVSGSIYLAIGRPSLSLLLEALTLAARVLAIILAAPYGLEAVAMTWPLVSIARVIVNQSLLYKAVGISPLITLACTWKSGVVTIFAFIFAYFGTVMFAKHQAWQTLGASLTLGALAWLLTSFALKHAIQEELRIIKNALVEWIKRR